MKLRLLCLISALWLLVACATEPKPATPPLDLRAAFLADADAVTVTDATVTFIDAAERKITLNRAPTSVAVLYASLTTLWYEAGGVVAGCIGSDAARALYAEVIGRDITLDDGVTSLARSAAAKNWSVEAIVTGGFDLIVAPLAMDGYATVAPAALAAGIEVIAVEYNDFADYLKWFKVFCHLTGAAERWESVALTALDAVMETLGNLPAGAPPRVLALFAGSEKLSAETPATVLGEMLTLLGAEHVVSAPGERVPINLEQIFVSDPDVIVVLCHGSRELAASTLEAATSGSVAWDSLRAVKAGRVYFLDRGLFHNKPNARFAEAYAVLAGLIYS